MNSKSKCIPILLLALLVPRPAETSLDKRKAPYLEDMRQEYRDFFKDQHDYQVEIDLLFENEISMARDKTKKYFDRYLSLVSKDDDQHRERMFSRIKNIYDKIPKTNEKAKILLKLQYLSYEIDYKKDKAFKNTIKYGNILQKEYPAYELLDRSLYLSGHALDVSGSKSEASKKFARLVRNFPKSTYFIHANMRLGDTYFAQEKYMEALPYYKVVKIWGVREFTKNVTYKMGWIYLKKNLVFLAADQFLELAEQEDLFQLVAQMFAESGGYKTAKKYFASRAGQSLAYVVYSLVGDYWTHQNQLSKANSIYRDIIKTFSTEPGNLVNHRSLLINLKKLGHSKKYYYEIIAFLDAYDQEGKWFRAQNERPDIQKEAGKWTTQYRYERVRFLHTVAEATKKPLDFLKASAGYREFIQKNPDSNLLEDANFNYAQTLYFAKKFDWAALEYEYVVETSSNKRFISPGILAMIKAFERHLYRKKRLFALNSVHPLTDKNGQALPEREFINDEKHYIKALTRFMRLDSIPFVKPVLYYKKGSLFLGNNYFNYARNSFFKTLRLGGATRDLKIKTMRLIITSYQMELG